MKQEIKKITPQFVLKTWQKAKLLAYKLKFMGKSHEEIFTKIHDKNYWGSEDSISGTGSTITQTKAVIEQLTKIMREHNVTSMLDIPCGDFYWMQYVDLNGIDYIGADIVDVLVEQNQKNFSTAHHSFQQLNIIKDELPTSDLVLVRDCLVHFSFEDIQKALVNIKRSGAKYLMATTFPKHQKNKNIVTGEWRTIDLVSEPFNFPEPILYLNEGCTEDDGIYEDKSLGLWEVSSLP